MRRFATNFGHLFTLKKRARAKNSTSNFTAKVAFPKPVSTFTSCSDHIATLILLIDQPKEVRSSTIVILLDQYRNETYYIICAIIVTNQGQRANNMSDGPVATTTQPPPTDPISSGGFENDKSTSDAAATETTTNGQPVPEYENELDWLLKVDVKTTLEHLHHILAECATNICNTTPASYSLLYCSQNQLDTVRVNANLEGYKIMSADINIKLSTKHPMQTIKTCIKKTPTNPFCWRLYQIQDANNHLNQAIDLLNASPLRLGPPLDDRHDESPFESGEEELQLIHGIMNSLQKSRSSLLIPKKSSVEELQHCQNMQSISPALPLDYSISFYVHANNLVCSVYHLAQSNNRAQVKNEYQAEVPIPYLADVLILLSLGLQICQQLKDKIQTLQNSV